MCVRITSGLRIGIARIKHSRFVEMYAFYSLVFVKEVTSIENIEKAKERKRKNEDDSGDPLNKNDRTCGFY